MADPGPLKMQDHDPGKPLRRDRGGPEKPSKRHNVDLAKSTVFVLRGRDFAGPLQGQRRSTRSSQKLRRACGRGTATEMNAADVGASVED